MKKGFELLKSRSLQEKICIESLENKYALKLPYLYKLFSEYFIMGDFKNDKYYVKKYNDKFQFSGVFYYPKGLGKNNIGITGLYKIEKVFENYMKQEGYGDNDLKKDLIRIADIGMGGGLFIATQKEEVDNVILSIWDKNPMYEKLAENIFEFIQGMELSVLPEEELIEACYNQLYKKYGESFWRVGKK